MIHVVAFGSAHTTNAVPGNSILVNLLNAGAAVGQNIAAKSVRRAPGLFIATGVLQRLSEQDYSAAQYYWSGQGGFRTNQIPESKSLRIDPSRFAKKNGDGISGF